ncbi:MAG: 16S rRNA (cytosine(967)-C(5))-methyltransferase RsmB [Candidatus Methanoperedens sp.]|nr:16S rRNA (cytosine(967)-C(5))-methyltransferase RsmB [Candidatus Methanoperedens sp.]MCZ7369268.1 16S rRNA (cytosine(967)-C(5))-methyltransferase RsmB [Candidatus Methanoperedens sp.]
MHKKAIVDNNNRSQFIRQKTYFAVLKLLDTISFEKKYPDALLGDLFKREEFSSSEKAAIVGLTYGILRHRARIDFIIENASRAMILGLDQNILNMLRICTYQAVFAQTSAIAILNNAIALSVSQKKFSGFVKRTVEGVLRNKDEIIFPDMGKNPVEHISIYHSHPSWIVEKWLSEFREPNQVDALCLANNLEPPLTIRVNPLKTDRNTLQSLLESEGYYSTPTVFSPFGLFVDKKEDIFKTEAFRSGLFEVQDEGSQLITLLTGSKPGECVIDACAGNGGKSLFLSGLMKAKGNIIALDTSKPKLANLRRRASRAGASNIKTSDIDEIHLYNGAADCVLIDAPCSGMGVFRRNPDSKWNLTREDIGELAVKQKEIIRNYSRLVKTRGRLVYATCTISREENEEIIMAFLEKNKDFHLIPASEVNPDIFSTFTTERGFFRSLPQVHNTDGFFAALMRRAGNS